MPDTTWITHEGRRFLVRVGAQGIIVRERVTENKGHPYLERCFDRVCYHESPKRPRPKRGLVYEILAKYEKGTPTHG